MQNYHVRLRAADHGGPPISLAQREVRLTGGASAKAGGPPAFLQLLAAPTVLGFLAIGCLNSVPLAPACATADCVTGGDVDAGASDAAQAPNEDMTEHHDADGAVGSLDGGSPPPKWSAQSVGNSDFAVVYGASASEVYLSGLRCTLLRSIDRGGTWKAIALPDCAPDTNGYLGIGRGSPGFYSIVGISASSPLSPPRATIYWTADSWQTASWQLDISSDAIPSGLVALGSTPTMQFAGDAHGKVIYSDNGGEKWRSTGDTALVRIGGVGAIAVLGGGKEVWAAGGHTLTSGGAALAHSKDGGATWSTTLLSAFPNALPSDSEMTAVWNASGTLWTSTISGRFYKSSDAGATWKGPLLTTGLGASQFWSSDADNVYAIVGTSIMHTIDGGKTWSQEASDLITGNLSSIWGRAADEIYVAGVGGLVLRYAPAQ